MKTITNSTRDFVINQSIIKQLKLSLIVLIVSVCNLVGQTTLTNFNEGAAIIDMGIANQTDNNGLKPYGLVVDLVNAGIPVNWIINPNKDFGSNSPGVLTKTDGVDITITGTTTCSLNSTPINSYGCKGGPFLIAAEFMVDNLLNDNDAYSIIQKWIKNNNGLTVYWNLNPIIDAPLHGVITSFPNIVVMIMEL